MELTVCLIYYVYLLCVESFEILKREERDSRNSGKEIRIANHTREVTRVLSVRTSILYEKSKYCLNQKRKGID